MGFKDKYTAMVEEAEAAASVGEPEGDDAKLVIHVTPAITVEDDLPELPPEVIAGIIRQGGKLLIAGASKSGKSYLLIELAVAVATGYRWCGFECAQGRVLYLNLEIQEPQFMHRVYRVYEKMQVTAEKVSKNLDIANLRGQFRDITSLVNALINSFDVDSYDLIIVDPAYKVQPGVENDADAITVFCGELDRLAENLKCTIAYTHHHSKGDQGNKNAQDRASGSGVFARDADALIDMTELDLNEDAYAALKLAHREGAIAYRLEFVLRDFKRPEPKDIWFRYPIHEEDDTDTLAECKIRKPGGNQKFHEDQNEKKRQEMEDRVAEYMGDRNSVRRVDFCRDEEVDARNVNKYLTKSARFKVVSGSSSADIVRIIDEG